MTNLDRQEKKMVRVCEYCLKPILWTFAFVGSEYYCPLCGRTGDMFWGSNVEATPRLLRLRRSLAIKFGQIRPHLYMGGERKKDCDKCFPKKGDGECHVLHLTEKETKKMELARNRLELIKENSK